MTKKILLALVAIAVMAVPAFASVQNIKVSGEIDSTYLVRDQFDLGQADSSHVTEDNFQALFITQTNLRVDADLSENVSATVALLNERAWGEENDDTDDSEITLDLAYVTLREMLYSPLTVVIGKQGFKYGNSLVIDSAGVNNVTLGAQGITTIAADLSKRTTQDAIRMIFDYNPLTVELLASKIDANNNAGTGLQKDDVDLFGANFNYKLGDSWDTVVESYFFSRIDRSDDTVVGAKADTVYNPGIRASTNPIKGLNVQGEFAWQGGNKATTHTAGTARADNVKRDAKAAQFIANYMLPFEQLAKWSPVSTLVYTYTSGDKGPDDFGHESQGLPSNDNYHAWDPMFENQGGGTIYNALFDLTNSHIIVASTQVNPIEDVTFKSTGTWIFLDRSVSDSTDTCGGASCPFKMRQPNTTSGVTNPTVTTNKDVGYELDFDMLYDYTEDVQLGLSMGWFFPGNFFVPANNSTAKQFLANVDVRF